MTTGGDDGMDAAIALRLAYAQVTGHHGYLDLLDHLAAYTESDVGEPAATAAEMDMLSRILARAAELVLNR